MIVTFDLPPTKERMEACNAKAEDWVDKVLYRNTHTDIVDHPAHRTSPRCPPCTRRTRPLPSGCTTSCVPKAPVCFFQGLAHSFSRIRLHLIQTSPPVGRGSKVARRLDNLPPRRYYCHTKVLVKIAKERSHRPVAWSPELPIPQGSWSKGRPTATASPEQPVRQ